MRCFFCSSFKARKVSLQNAIAVIAQRAATALQKLLFPLHWAGGVPYYILLAGLVGWCTSGSLVLPPHSFPPLTQKPPCVVWLGTLQKIGSEFTPENDCVRHLATIVITGALEMQPLFVKC